MDAVFPQVSQRRLWQLFISCCTLVLKLQLWLPGDFTLVDLQASLGHVSHPLLALLAGVHGQVMDVRSFICHFKVADAAVALSRRWERKVSVCDRDRILLLFLMIRWESNLSAEVDDPSVGVIKGQEDATTGVQLLQVQGLAKVILLTIIEADSQTDTRGLIQSNPAWNDALAVVKHKSEVTSLVSWQVLVCEGKMSVYRPDLIGFMGQSVSGSKQAVLFRLAPMRCRHSLGPTAPPVSHSCDWSRWWGSSRWTQRPPGLVWSLRGASPSPESGAEI